MTPQRIQLKRAKGWRLQDVSRALNGLPAVKVDRSTQWGNDFTIEDCGSAEWAVEMFRHDLDKFSCFHGAKYLCWIEPLRGKNLACWCEPGQPCHADVLLELANAPAPA